MREELRVRFRETLEKNRRAKASRSDGRTASTLEALTDGLQNLVGRFMLDRHDRGGPVSRAVAAAQVLAAEPGLHRRIEQAAVADQVHKSIDGEPAWRPYDKAVASLSKALGGDDVIVGRQLVAKNFPRTLRAIRRDRPRTLISQ